MQQRIENILAHYGSASESTRLDSALGQLEFRRTQFLIKQYLAPPPLTILDVGGGAGVYSLWLASEGYTVHLIDVVPKHIEQALQAASQSQHPFESASVGDARSLKHSNESVDAVLLLGPLYHLLDRDHRMLALREAHRVLKESGILFAVGISRFASTLDGMWRKLLDDPDFVPIVQKDLKDGQHKNTTNKLDYFTDAFFHLPLDLRSEVEQAGFTVETLSAIEGPAWLLPDLADWLGEAKQRDLLMTLLDQIASHESLIGVSDHLMVVGRKAGS
jgi:ubiquinone/menaquinone biosynthesis C-methylase UbiE